MLSVTVWICCLLSSSSSSSSPSFCSSVPQLLWRLQTALPKGQSDNSTVCCRSCNSLLSSGLEQRCRGCVSAAANSHRRAPITALRNETTAPVLLKRNGHAHPQFPVSYVREGQLWVHAEATAQQRLDQFSMSAAAAAAAAHTLDHSDSSCTDPHQARGQTQRERERKTVLLL